jgi:hypothetical protein
VGAIIGTSGDAAIGQLVEGIAVSTQTHVPISDVDLHRACDYGSRYWAGFQNQGIEALAFLLAVREVGVSPWLAAHTPISVRECTPNLAMMFST